MMDHQLLELPWAFCCRGCRYARHQVDLRVRIGGELHIEEDEAQPQTHSDDGGVVPWSLLFALEHTGSDFTLPQSGHGKTNGAVGHQHLAEGSVSNQVSRGHIMCRWQVSQQDGLHRQGVVLVNDERDVPDVLAATNETVCVLRVGAVVIHLAGVGVAYTHGHDAVSIHQADHAPPAVGLVARVRAGPIDWVDGEVDVPAWDRARDVQSFFFTDHAEVGEAFAE